MTSETAHVAGRTPGRRRSLRAAAPTGPEIPSHPAELPEVVEDVFALDRVGQRLGAAPHDRDPLLWAAHESVRCARLLLEARSADPGREADLLAEAMAGVRSATASVHYALRERVGTSSPAP